MFRKTVSLAGAAVLAVALGSSPTPAHAETSAASAPCTLDLGSVTADGAHTFQTLRATTPVIAGTVRTAPGVFQPGQPQHTTNFRNYPAPPDDVRSGLVVLGGALYDSGYRATATGQINPKYPVVNRRIGGGWSNHRWIEQSVLTELMTGNPLRTNLYTQKTDGTFYRYTKVGNSWRNSGGMGGLTTMKSMTLIDREAGHETFLANNRAGGLYTVRIPTAEPMRASSKALRTTTWQVFEQLIATGCGNDTVVLGIDRDTKSAYLYLMRHANGASTVIQGLGKVPGTFADPHYFRWAPGVDLLNGE
ncbi:hypothetical protein [Kribbella catacumbae]|uniref:hypothetical protein n=1 Tax=Kribbella catacumbae TaxID=460086 RepID=UPI00037D6659|nr:hypothetical protein [Kribbella catacumbae]